jgi:hypothetical protein
MFRGDEEGRLPRKRSSFKHCSLLLEFSQTESLVDGALGQEIGELVVPDGFMAGNVDK